MVQLDGPTGYAGLRTTGLLSLYCLERGAALLCETSLALYPPTLGTRSAGPSPNLSGPTPSLERASQKLDHQAQPLRPAQCPTTLVPPLGSQAPVTELGGGPRFPRTNNHNQQLHFQRCGR
ncbi:unnamed protein product [Linum trigynum]|uniref:Uncharacterized protein n=1 Tax=Linum trigynum TaxID=586398 RepID=A0AAV2GVU6_9ROSI